MSLLAMFPLISRGSGVTVAAVMTGFTFPTGVAGFDWDATYAETTSDTEVQRNFEKQNRWFWVLVSSLFANLICTISCLCQCMRRKRAVKEAARQKELQQTIEKRQKEAMVKEEKQQKEVMSIRYGKAKGILLWKTVEELRAEADGVGYVMDSSRITKQMLVEMILAKGGDTYVRMLTAQKSKTN